MFARTFNLPLFCTPVIPQVVSYNGLPEPFTVIANLPRWKATHLTSPHQVTDGMCRSAITAEMVYRINPYSVITTERI